MRIHPCIQFHTCTNPKYLFWQIFQVIFQSFSRKIVNFSEKIDRLDQSSNSNSLSEPSTAVHLSPTGPLSEQNTLHRHSKRAVSDYSTSILSVKCVHKNDPF
jgi:hypothetical protein